MNPLADQPFARMNGAGNAILVLDLRGSHARTRPQDARAIFRGAGLQFDQLMEVSDSRTQGSEAFVRIFNNDGSQSGACGNGARCVAFYLLRGRPEDSLRIETLAGMLDCVRDAATVFTVDMGAPRLDWAQIPLRESAADTRRVALPEGAAIHRLQAFGAVNMGNPHAVFFVDDLAAYDLAAIGPMLEHHPIFPEKANISLARVVARDRIVLKVWERNVGLTLACGSAACAALVAAARNGLTERSATVSLPGGELFITWRESDDHVLMRGPVELEWEGRLDPALFEGLAV